MRIITVLLASLLYCLRTLRAHGMHKDCLHEVFHSTVLAKLYYMQAQLGRVSALQAKSTNSTDSSTDASLTTTATRQLHMFLNYLMWQIKKERKRAVLGLLLIVTVVLMEEKRRM